MAYSNQPVRKIIIELIRSQQMFRYLFSQISNYRYLNRDHTESINEVYRRTSENISRNLLEPLKNKQVYHFSFDSIDFNHGVVYQAMVDQLIFDMGSLMGIHLSHDQAYEFVNRIELSMIDDICEFIPNIDELTMTVYGFACIGNNGVVIDILFHNENFTNNQFR
jgi:hypothetical protein